MGILGLQIHIPSGNLFVNFPWFPRKIVRFLLKTFSIYILEIYDADSLHLDDKSSSGLGLATRPSKADRRPSEKPVFVKKRRKKTQASDQPVDPPDFKR
jgi:hypothetical protein